MTRQPFDDPLRVTSHGRGWRVVHVCEDGIEHRTGTLHQPFNVLVDLAVDVREEEKILVPFDHEPGVMHGTELVLCFCEIGHQRGQLFGERLGVCGSLDREVNREVALAHRVSPCVSFRYASAALFIERRSTNGYRVVAACDLRSAISARTS